MRTCFMGSILNRMANRANLSFPGSCLGISADGRTLGLDQSCHGIDGELVAEPAQSRNDAIGRARDVRVMAEALATPDVAHVDLDDLAVERQQRVEIGRAS